MHKNVGSNPGTRKRFPFVKAKFVLIFDSFMSGKATCNTKTTLKSGL